MNRNAMLGFKWDYGHQNYIDDLKRKEMYKAGLMQGVKQCKLSFFKRRKVIKLVNTLQKLAYLLDEPIQTNMMLNEEVWSCDCLEYRIDFVYEYINKMSIKPQKVSVEEIYPLCQVEMDIDIRYVEMTEALRKSKSTRSH
ncbi:MAG: hypothetical protein J6A59_17105 [Lachnospiraceae bacterium]|nr:hypothetical protein [Lachnospiraceae bacterium]